MRGKKEVHTATQTSGMPPKELFRFGGVSDTKEDKRERERER